MISNNTTYKLKTSKSRDLNDYDYNHGAGADNFENESAESDVVENSGRYGGSRESPYRGSNRSRATEYRSSRNHERADRRGFRSKGNPFGRRSDRDYSDNFHVLNRKYDSGRGDSGLYHGKHHEQEKKNEIKLNLPEDTRISKLLRRLSIETDQENSLLISKKLLEVLLLPDNALYVRKAFHILGESMFDILQVSPGQLAKQQAARALGRMGYIMGQENDFERYQNWLFNKINHAPDDMVILFMKSLKETMAFEKSKSVLQDHAQKLFNNLVTTIEATENAEVFKNILDVLLSTVEIYPDAINSQFHDTIDLLFGWHVDHTQPLTNIEFISKNLQRISRHFQQNLELSVSLTENFLDDIMTYSTQMLEGDASAIDHVTVLILALNTIIKCLDTSFHPYNNKYVTVDFINNCLSQLIKTLSDALDAYVPDNLIIAANECIGVLLSYLENKSATLCATIYNLLDVELALLGDFADATIISLLILISRVIKELSANLPIELIEKLIGLNSPIIDFRYSAYKTIRESVISVYQALLNLKNVSLLQEAYRYVLGDLEVVYRQIVPDVQPFTQNNPFEFVKIDLDADWLELTALFLLRCLSQLANASSIIVMWVLKPSILELVGVDLQPYNPILAKNAPNLQYSLLFLLYSHCKCYNHFISNSSLVAKKLDQPCLMSRFALTESLGVNDVPNTSPNSGNFAIILDIIYKTLNVEGSIEVHLLLFQWLNDILINSEIYLETLYDNEKFTPITEVLVRCGYNSNSKVVLAVYENLDKLLSNKQLSWNNTFLTNICDLCKLHMNSVNRKVRESYSKLCSHIPWDIAIVQFNKPNCTFGQQKNISMKTYNNHMILFAQRLHLNGIVYGEMYPFVFKRFMDYLLKNEQLGDHWLEDMFTLCWDYDEEHPNSELIYELAVNSQTILHSWVALEAAEFCVNLKLRTPLGKPNETFTKIEGALNQLGNDLISLKKEDKVNRICPERVRLLIQFIEQLEKLIYNAAEGCAVAMMQPSKSVRSFFIANANTCNEWLSRIRLVIIHIALHVGDFSAVVRHGQALLKDLVNGSKSCTIEFERTAMFVTLALLNLRETEAIYGVYVWCKTVAGRRFSWIKCAAEQSSRRYEIAIQGYITVLSSKQESSRKCSESSTEENDNNKKMDSDIHHFILDQILMCYKELENFTGMTELYNNQVVPLKNIENGRRYWFSTIDWQCYINLFNIESDTYTFNELSRWDYKGEPKSWSTYDCLSTVENNLYNLAVEVAVDKEHCIKKLEINQTLIQKSIQEQLNSAPSELLQNFCLMNYISSGLKHITNNTTANSVFLVSENFENEVNKIDSPILRQILWWSEYFGQIQNQPLSTFCSNLRLDIMKRARKEKNFQLAIDYFYKFLRGKELLFDLTDNQHNELWFVGSYFVQEVSKKDCWNIDVSRAVTEIIKLSYAKEEQKRYYTLNLCAAASTEISKHADKVFGGHQLRTISSKILLKLASWLQTNEQISLTELNSPLGKLLMVLPEIGMMESTVTTVIPQYEMAVGKLLQFSVHQCPSLGKNWNAFGTWCYRWGRKVIDSSGDIKNNLTEEDCLGIKTILPSDITQEDLTKILAILSQTRTAIDEEDIDSNEINTSEMIQSQLQCIGALRNATEQQLQGLVQIWRNTQKRIYAYYALSAEAYFKYLQLATNSENITKSTEFNTITVTLRLLRLIVKYALELQCILEEGLQLTPTQPWKVIIPQLFSRLNHPESYVRQRVSDLLCRVAEDAPHLITFPAVVGALDGGLKFNFSEISMPKDCLSQNNEEENEYTELQEEVDNFESDQEDGGNALQSCFKTMVDTLSKQDPEMIAQVQTFVKELRRITLLWDELWLGTLAQHHSEITKRQQQLEYEIEKVGENPNLMKDEKISLIAEKHRIIMKPIIFILEQLQDVTSVEAETPHEKHFQERYLAEIKDVIKKLKNPQNPDKPVQSLQPLKTLQKKFQQKFHKRGSYSLKMHDISPILAAVKNTVIVMPGLSTTAKARVTISHVSNSVSILPTKTKPKKLAFYGSDGQTYTYLFKGLEDLHLDERIMQFLSIANTMMENTDSQGQNLYRAKHYSVIPLGPRSGLISWVDGTTPVFTVYKRWQQRESVKPSTKNNINTNTTVLRPSELFYKKLNPLLQEHGVKNIENRKEWPLAVLKQVLTELMAETPSDLLAKELWCNSVSAASWWQVVKRYSYSVAVMSIIGYIIGLGDRHLDNVLVDLNTGEVVHIDYNVCFEKGKTLRVPEKVPFRLTPNIRDALGVTGVEGIFRLACENVLKIMRKGRETLLTLLEAFVYDPLIDWTVGGEVLAGTTFGAVSNKTSTRQSRKELEKEVTLSMFSVRCTEMKVEWIENKQEILDELPVFEENLKSYLHINKKLTETEDYLQDLHQQMALIKEAEAHGANKHPLYSLPGHYDSYHKTRDALNTARRDLDKIITAAEKHLSAYNSSLRALDTSQVNQWLIDLNITIDSDTNIFDLVKEFLHSAGKNDVIVQCEQSEAEVAKLTQVQNKSARKCIVLLQEYYAILSQCPKSFIENHRMNKFLKWSKYLLESKTLESCEVVYENLRTFLDVNSSPQVPKFAYGLDAMCKDTIAQVNKTFDDLKKRSNHESNALLEKVYANARMGMQTFLSCEKGATNALEFVIASELVILNQSFLTLETTAHRSGDYLIKLTTRDGDWFLDDLVQNSARSVELISNLPLVQNGGDMRFYQVLNGIKIANNVYKGLQELNFNFHTIILPESMKKIQSEEPSVIQMIVELKSVILSIGVSIPDMIIQLEKILPCLLLQMDLNPSYQVVLETVSSIRTKFQMLVQNQNQAETLTPGKMLLMGFNGLFEKLTQELNSLVSSLGNLDIPPQWKKLDHVKEAKSISAHIFNPEVHKILDDIFLLKRLQAISDFFTLAQDMCQSFKGSNSLVLSDEQLTKPIRQFIADFISRQVLGITTETIAYAICFLFHRLGLDITKEIEQQDIGVDGKVAIDELYHKAWNFVIKQGLFTSNVLSQGSSLETNLKTAWEKLQEPKIVEQKLAILQSSVLRMQNQLTVHNFMYEDVLKQYIFSPVRSKFIIDLRNEMASLKTVSEKLTNACEKQKALVDSAHQRLNWAKGANPNVVEISAAFISAVESRNIQMNLQQNISSDLLGVCNSVLQHEVLRSHCSDSKNYDKMFLNSFEKWRIACQYTNVKSDMLSSTEESIMNLLTPELIGNPKWLQIISENISDLINLHQKTLSEKKTEMFKISDDIMLRVEILRNLYGIHLKLMTDVKGLIKTMAKIEDYTDVAHSFKTTYCEYIEKMTAIFNRFKKDFTKDDVVETMKELKSLEEYTKIIYDDLLNLESKKDLLLGRDCLTASPVNYGQQLNTSKGQQRNAYAVSVWRRVKMKLEGRDPDPGRKCTPQEQVDYVIREATSLDNLALLYEGWTPWV